MTHTRAHGLRPPHPTTHLRPPAVRMVAALSLAASLAGAGMVSAQPPTAATILSPADAQRAGFELQLARRVARGQLIVELRRGPRSANVATRLLDVAPGGVTAAVATGTRPADAALALLRGDGSVVLPDLPGVLGAAFAPDASWAAVVDATGALWRVATDGTVARRIADGPFSIPLRFSPDGSILVRAVSSVEAPYRSDLVRLDPQTGATATVAAGLVYRGVPLDDGSVAVTVHEPGKTLVRRVAADSRPIADLGPRAINVDVSGDGQRIAWEVAGDGVYLLELGKPGRRLTAGGEPTFAPDGRSLLVRTAAGSSELGLDGKALATLSADTTFARCLGECRP